MLRIFSSLYLLILLFCFGGIIINNAFFSLYKEAMQEDVAKDYNAAFIMLKELHVHLNDSELTALYKKVTTESNTPMQIKTLEEWRLPDEKNQLLKSGGIYVADYDDDILYKHITNNFVVKIGPMQTIKSVENLIPFLILIMASFLGFIVLLWSAWQQYKIKRLTTQTQNFSEGKLNSRAPMGILSVPILSHAFNIMAERIERLFQSHKHLTNAVSHELRSPIARARFQLELFDSEQSDSERNQLLIGLAENLDDMDSLVDEMLNYTKMERCEPILALETIEIVQWLRDQEKYMLGEVSKALYLKLPETPIQARFDQLLITRLLRNVISNANRHAKKQIVISLKKENNSIIVRIDDDGDGIPINMYNDVFKPFVRLDNSRSRDTGGHGLGLAIAAQIARCHGGTLTIQDSPLGGARFIFSWPMIPIKDADLTNT